MMVEQGFVTGTLANGKASVKIIRGSACEGCSSKDTCHVTTTEPGKEIEVEVLNAVSAREGDRVEISIPTSSFVQLTFLVYFVPVIAMVAGAVAGADLIPGYLGVDTDAGAVMGGFAALALAVIFAKILNRGVETRERYWPRITRILGAGVPLQCAGNRSGHSAGSASIPQAPAPR